MKRLLEKAPEHDGEAGLAELVRHAQKYQSNPFRKRMILSRIHSPPRVSRFSGKLIAGVVLLGSATAAAAAGYRWVSQESDAAPGTASAPALRQRTPELAPTPTAARVEQAPQSPAATSTSDAPAQPSAAPADSSASGSAKSLAPRGAAKLAGEDPAPVLEALRSLRKSGDPDRAQQLLDGYLRSHPKGALSEEALALAIEAALARRDPRAADYARQYLAKYPKGRFTKLSRSVLERR